MFYFLRVILVSFCWILLLVVLFLLRLFVKFWRSCVFLVEIFCFFWLVVFEYLVSILMLFVLFILLLLWRLMLLFEVLVWCCCLFDLWEFFLCLEFELFDKVDVDCFFKFCGCLLGVGFLYNLVKRLVIFFMFLFMLLRDNVRFWLVRLGGYLMFGKLLEVFCILCDVVVFLLNILGRNYLSC